MIFQNFGFNRIAGGWPSQAKQIWTAADTAQWLSQAGKTFTIGNGVTYGTATSISTSLGNVYSGVMASNGKIYMGGDSSSNIWVWDTNTNSMSTISAPNGLVSYMAVYNDYTKCAYFNGNGVFYVVDTLTDTVVATITNPLGTTYALLYSSGYDARYIYGNGWFQNNGWFKIDCDNNTASTISGQSSGGDTLQGPMAKNGKIYMGGGGGSNSGFHVWNANTDTNQFVSAMGNITDNYRGAANHYDGYLYTLPAYGASNIWQIDPTTNGASVVLGSISSGPNPTNHIMGADGLIYAFGNSNTLGVYNPVANSYSTVTLPSSGNYQWSVLDKMGNMYYGQNTDLWQLPASGVASPISYNGLVARMRQ